MLKNKVINRLLNNIVLASLLVGTPALLPLNGQVQKTENLKLKIDQKIKDIKQVVINLNRAKIIIPSIVLVAGATIVVIAGLLGIAAWKYSKGKLFKKLQDTELSTSLMQSELTSLNLGQSELNKQLETAMEKRKSIQRELFVVVRKEAPHYKRMESKIVDINTELNNIMKKLSTQDGLIIEKNEDIKSIAEKMKSIESRMKTAQRGTALSVITTALATSVISPLLTFAAFKFLSRASIKKASQAVIKLEQIEKKLPHILTKQQRNVIAQFKNLYKNPTALGIIQGLKLKDALIAAADTAMLKHHSLVAALGGQKKALKTITTYIRLKWQEKKLQKAAAQHVAIKKSGFKPLNRTKKKIAKLEARHPQLKAALQNAEQAYTTQADTILKELNEQVMKAIETEELEKRRVTPGPVISL